jgi:hypothetical protein
VENGFRDRWVRERRQRAQDFPMKSSLSKIVLEGKKKATVIKIWPMPDQVDQGMFCWEEG